MTRGGGLHAAIVERARVAAWDDMVAEVEPVKESAAGVADRVADLSQAAFEQILITEEQAAQLANFARVVVVLQQFPPVLTDMADVLDVAGSPAGPGLRALAAALDELAGEGEPADGDLDMPPPDPAS